MKLRSGTERDGQRDNETKRSNKRPYRTLAMVCLDLKYSQPQGFSVIEILTKTLKNRSRFDSTAPQEIYAGQHNLK